MSELLAASAVFFALKVTLKVVPFMPILYLKYES